QLKQRVREGGVAAIADQMSALGCKTTRVVTGNGSYLVGIGSRELDIRKIEHMEGVADGKRVSDVYKLVEQKLPVERNVMDVGDGVVIGDGDLALMAGPCSIESEEQVAATLAHLRENNVRIMRGGVFKPRSSPYAFRGLGTEGLKMWYKQARAAGVKIISEV